MMLSPVSYAKKEISYRGTLKRLRLQAKKNRPEFCKTNHPVGDQRQATARFKGRRGKQQEVRPKHKNTRDGQHKDDIIQRFAGEILACT